jgi:hypothetical protein
MSEDFDHGHEPRAEEIALHQRFLTLLGQMEAAQTEGNETEVRRLDPLLERAGRAGHAADHLVDHRSRADLDTEALACRKRPCNSRTLSRGDDDFSLSVSLSEIPERFGDSTQFVLPVYDRCQCPGLEKLLQDDQVLFLDLRQKRSHHTAAPGKRTDA